MKKIICFLSLFTTIMLRSQTCSNPAVVQIGYDSLQNMSTTWPSVYGNWYSNEKYQILYTAAELQANGVMAGLISSIAFDVASLPQGMNTTFLNYSIKLGTTSVGDLDPNGGGFGTIPFVTPITTQVWGPQNYTAITGWNTHTFPTPFLWDGTSNIVVEICYTWVASGSYSYNAIINSSVTNYRSFLVYNSDGTVSCPEPNGNQSFLNRPNTRFGCCQGVVAKAYNDINSNCTPDANELGVGGLTVTLNPGNYTGVTNTYGGICFNILPDGIYTATIDTTNIIWSTSCPTVQTFSVVNGAQSNLAMFGMTPTNPCSLPEVSIFSSFLRPCFSDVVFVSVSNDLSATATINNSYVDVELDSLQIVTTATLPYTSLSNNKFRFQLPTIYPGQSTSFQIFDSVSCTAIAGQSLCMEAILFPIQPCMQDSAPTPPYPGTSICNLPWDNSSLSVIGFCNNDTVCFTITNTGQAGNGDMQCYSPVRVYVNAVLTFTDSIQLAGGQTKSYCFPSYGESWILQADQHPLHPGNSHPNAHVEGCGDTTTTATSFVNQLPLDDADPYVDIYCGTVTASFDPNDKTGYPLGTGNNHDILPNQQLQYVIRFQNTGTDTAFTVVVRDTLSTDLDIASVKAGVASHNYTFNIHGPRVLEWTFSNIMLPDSNINESASHGFITFTVEQLPNRPNGTQINNTAGIYFDFNAPVITNTSLHTVNYLAGVATGIKPASGIQNNFVQVYPNPFSSAITIQTKEEGIYLLSVTDITGKLVAKEKFAGNKLMFEKTELKPGVYLFEVTDKNGNASRGKLIKQ
jgi:uncharacterized repeat protein (TIGR01451 family)